ncbi:MAG TPA: DoxX family protein [Solirubrobacterales bacterium]|nr:DoxX family protein [Solirubrobacterales bacterium]
MDVVFLIGRILFVVPFVLSGLTNHFSRQGVEYARNYGAPAPGLMVPLSGAAIVAGGLSVALGSGRTSGRWCLPRSRSRSCPSCTPSGRRRTPRRSRGRW